MKSRLVLVAGGVLLAGTALAQLQILTNLGGTFTDISGSGTALNPTDDSEHNISTTVGNAIFAAGNVRVGNNGGMGFGITNGDLGFLNVAIPANGGIGAGETGVFANSTPAHPQVLLPYWDDLLPGPTGNIFWQEAMGTLIVQWNSEGHFLGGGATATFQIKIFSAGPVFAQFLYNDINGLNFLGGQSATIGYMDGAVGGPNAGNNIQYSFNTANAVTNGTVLSIVPEPGTFVAIGIGLAGLALARRRR
jgi:hypothetical protein